MYMGIIVLWISNSIRNRKMTEEETSQGGKTNRNMHRYRYNYMYSETHSDTDLYVCIVGHTCVIKIN